MIETSQEINKVAEAWSKVQEGVEYVQKTGEVNQGKRGSYSYASDLDLLEAVKEKARGLGLAFVSNAKVISVEEIPTRNGSTRLTTAELTLMLIHSESGQWMRSTMVGTGADSQDKGLYKAITGALKYWLRTSLLIPTGDDPDQYASEPAPSKAKKSGDLKKAAKSFAKILSEDLEWSEEEALEVLREEAAKVAVEDNRSQREVTKDDLRVAVENIFEEEKTHDD